MELRWVTQAVDLKEYSKVEYLVDWRDRSVVAKKVEMMEL